MANGWILKVEHLGQQRSGGDVRTYGRYTVLINGHAAEGLAGFICECPGPGDNAHPGNKKRIEAGSYPLWTQFGKYRSIGYASSGPPGAGAMPGIALAATGRRSGILIHPAHPPTLYLSSIGCFNPTSALGATAAMDFDDSRARVIALLDSLKAYAPHAFEHEVMTRIGDAVIEVVDGPDALLAASAPQALAAAATEDTAVLPLSKSAGIKCIDWLNSHFGDAMRAATAGKPYGIALLCGIVCKETAYKWVPWIDRLSPADIVARAVFDASGDYPGTSRSAFPTSTAVFRAAYGDALTDMLIEEANKTRRLQQGYGDKAWVYKGYGLFQYDLQAIKRDLAFFRDRQWYDFGICLAKATGELDAKLRQQNGDLWEAVRAYNGAGARAREYAGHVRIFTGWAQERLG